MTERTNRPFSPEHMRVAKDAIDRSSRRRFRCPVCGAVFLLVDAALARAYEPGSSLTMCHCGAELTREEWPANGGTP